MFSNTLETLLLKHQVSQGCSSADECADSLTPFEMTFSKNDAVMKKFKLYHYRSYLLLGFPAVFLVAYFVLSNPLRWFATAQKQAASSTTPGVTCGSSLARSLSLRCIPFQEHLYAVIDIDLERRQIVFTTSDDAKREAFPVVVSKLSRAGIQPVLVTNAGIYGMDNRPLGLLVSPKGKVHDLNAATGAAGGNFSWDSAVFQIADDGTASIVPARSWHDNGRTIAATQSGPQLASSGKINQSFQAQSNRAFTRTAIGVDQSNRKLVHLVVSREAVTLFELATFMTNELHCSEALHLDGDLSAFYIPMATEKFLFFDPGERIVTALSVVEKSRPHFR